MLGVGGLLAVSAVSRHNDPALAPFLPGWGKPLSFEAENGPEQLGGVFDVVDVQRWDRPMVHLSAVAPFASRAQGITTADHPRNQARKQYVPGRPGSAPCDPEVCVVRPAAPSPRASDRSGEKKRAYHHRCAERIAADAPCSAGDHGALAFAPLGQGGRGGVGEGDGLREEGVGVGGTPGGIAPTGVGGVGEPDEACAGCVG